MKVELIDVLVQSGFETLIQLLLFNLHITNIDPNFIQLLWTVLRFCWQFQTYKAKNIEGENSFKNAIQTRIHCESIFWKNDKHQILS